jgi:hypothetical protein
MNLTHIILFKFLAGASPAEAMAARDTKTFRKGDTSVVVQFLTPTVSATKPDWSVVIDGVTYE